MKLKQWLKENRYSYVWFGDQLGVSRQAVCMALNSGKRLPTTWIPTVLDIAGVEVVKEEWPRFKHGKT